MNAQPTHRQGLTLEEIATRKQALKAAITKKKKQVNEAYRQIVEPFSNVKSVSKYVGNNLLNSFTVFESAIWGYRLISRLFRIFKRFR